MTCAQNGITEYGNPYTKNIQINFCPSRPYDKSQWNNAAEIDGAGYGLNIGLTGSLNTWTTTGTSLTKAGAFRNSWTGGTLAGVNSAAEAMLLMETNIPGVGAYNVGVAQQTSYPLATREYWQGLMKPGGAVDHKYAPHADGVIVAYCDGHSKWLKVDSFLGKCPTAAQYGNVPIPNSEEMSWTISAAPTWTQPWPFWNLQ